MTNKTVLGGAAGLLVAVLLLIFGISGFILIAMLVAVGALIGLVLERPEALSGLLQKLSDRCPPPPTPELEPPDAPWRA